MIPDAIIGVIYSLIDVLISWLPNTPDSVTNMGQTGFGEAYSWIATANYYFPISEMAKAFGFSILVYQGFAVYKFVREIIP